MKVINIKTCGDCPYNVESRIVNIRHCKKMRFKDIYHNDKPFPVWCPLEDV
jgi:hypothetical protein